MKLKFRTPGTRRYLRPCLKKAATAAMISLAAGTGFLCSGMPAASEDTIPRHILNIEISHTDGSRIYAGMWLNEVKLSYFDDLTLRPGQNYLEIMVLPATMPPPREDGVKGDIDGDGQVGLPEAIHALQVAAGMRK